MEHGNGHVYSGWDKICNPQPWTDATRPEWLTKTLAVMEEGDSITRAYDVRRARWRELSTRGSEPRPRYRHAAALLPAPAAGAGAAMAVWGGYLRRAEGRSPAGMHGS